MATNESTATAGDTLTPRMSLFARRWGWLLFLGIVQIICGGLALAIPIAASLAAAIVFGSLLLVTGIFQCVHASGVKSWKGALFEGLGGLLYVAAGVFILMFPLTGAFTLAIIIGALLVADGIVRCVLAYRVRPRDGWGWLLAAGIASTAMGIIMLLGWPVTGLWAVGVLLGVNLLFCGITNCAMAVTFRTQHARDPDQGSFDHAHRHA